MEIYAATMSESLSSLFCRPEISKSVFSDDDNMFMFFANSRRHL